MPISRTKKTEIVKDLKDKVTRSKAVIFAKFHGMSVAKMSEFRKNLRAKDADFTVAKKTLIGIAFKESGRELPGSFEGEIGVIAGYGDELAVFKAASDLAKKEKEAFQLVGGFFEGTYADASMVRALGSIPSREALIAQLMSVLVGNTRKLVYMLDQIQKKKAAEGSISG